jgi:glycosyltransferase involved in cell wall biosynthesis
MTERPEISVVIPTRDRWPLLVSRALPAALEQEDVDHEVIVVDDGSREAVTVPPELASARIRVVRREHAGGMALARNTGLKEARGEWIAFLDDDDLWSPRKLQAQLETARSEQAEWVYAAAIAVDERRRVLHRLYLPPAQELREKLQRACVIPAGCSNVIARTSLIRSVGGFDETLVHVADWDLWITLADAGKAAVRDDVLVAYVLHDRNMHVVDDPSREIDVLVRKHARAHPARRISPDRLGYSRWVASQRSRVGLHRQAAAVYLRAALRHRSPGNVLRAFDALLGKRASKLATKMSLRSKGAEPEPPPAPEWLRRYAT